MSLIIPIREKKIESIYNGRYEILKIEEEGKFGNIFTVFDSVEKEKYFFQFFLHIRLSNFF